MRIFQQSTLTKSTLFIVLSVKLSLYRLRELYELFPTPDRNQQSYLKILQKIKANDSDDKFALLSDH
jgi:hypothetical protein